MPRNQTNRLLGLREVAERLGLSLHTVRRWASERRFPTVHLGGRVLVKEMDLEQLIEKHSCPARQDLVL